MVHGPWSTVPRCPHAAWLLDGKTQVDSVLSGAADFGVGTSDLLLRRSRGEPVVALAVISQHSPHVLVAYLRQDRDTSVPLRPGAARHRRRCARRDRLHEPRAMAAHRRHLLRARHPPCRDVPAGLPLRGQSQDRPDLGLSGARRNAGDRGAGGPGPGPAFYDPLTELPNRALFFDRLGHELARCRRSGKSFGLLALDLDLDAFKAVNDTPGHETGDALLQAVARRLRDCVRESNTVARMRGDEFVILLHDMKELDGAVVVAEKVIAAISRPFLLSGCEFRWAPASGSAWPRRTARTWRAC